MALRLSGRLMVIQKACPRFSRITLLWSVMVSLACFAHVLANICGRMGVDRKRDLALRDGPFLHPALVFVEVGPASGRHRIRAGQHVDAGPADMRLAGMNGLSDQ